MDTLSALMCDAAHSQLVVIDIQGRLASAMPSAEREKVLANTGRLSQAAGLLDVPLIATEQYPRGLGPTDADLAEQFPPQSQVVEKTCFACSGESQFVDALEATERRQIVLAGMESHVCVLQTALSLMAQGYTVFVVEDAVCSRRAANSRNAMERLRAAGVIITNTESVLFEWLRDAQHEHFRQISALIK